MVYRTLCPKSRNDTRLGFSSCSYDHNRGNDNLGCHDKSNVDDKPSWHDLVYNFLHGINNHDRLDYSLCDLGNENVHIHKQQVPDDEHKCH